MEGIELGWLVSSRWSRWPLCPIPSIELSIMRFVQEILVAKFKPDRAYFPRRPSKLMSAARASKKCATSHEHTRDEPNNEPSNMGHVGYAALSSRITKVPHHL